MLEEASIRVRKYYAVSVRRTGLKEVTKGQANKRIMCRGRKKMQDTEGYVHEGRVWRKYSRGFSRRGDFGVY